MDSAFFITERYLKNNSPLGDNIDVKEIYPYAKTCEDIYIQELIGTCLYDRLVESLNASPSDYNSDEETLMKMIRTALVWLICFEATPFIWMKLRPIGLVKQAGENMESVSMAEMNMIRKEQKNKADFYLKRIQDYLCCNGSLFPEYKCTCSRCSITPGSVKPSCDLAFERDYDEEYKNFYKKWLL